MASRDDVPAWRRYLRFWGSNVSADVDEEIAFHLEELFAEFVASGISPDEARRLAGQRFGDPNGIARSLRTLAHQRENTMRRSEWLDAFNRDFHFALRQLAKRPGFTIVAVLTLALGIGANTAIFSAVNSVLLRPLPVSGLDRLVFIHDNLPKLPLLETQLDPTETLELTNHKDLFVAVGGVAGSANVLTGTGEPRRLAAARTIGRFFDVFGQGPYLGRFYRPDESENDQHRVIVLAYDFWQELGARPSIVGQSLQLNGVSYQVVGVAGRGFRYPRGVQLWSPFALNADTKVNHGRLIMSTIGRLRDDVTPQQLQAKLDAVMRKLHERAKPDQFYMSNRAFLDEYAGELRPALLVLLGAVGFVLLIACANVASLQLVHGAARTREMAVRAALGASRGTIIRQLLVENFVLSIAGGLLGLAIGGGILRLLAFAGAAQLPALQDVRLSGAVLGFTAAATIVSGLFFGIIPAMKAGRVDLNDALKEGTRGASLGSGKHRALQAGIVVQVALTLMLLLGAGLMIRSLRELLAQQPGFDAERVSTVRVTVSGTRYAGGPQLTSFYDDLLGRLAATPVLGAVGMISELPFSGSNDSSPFVIRGRTADPSQPAMHANLHTIGGDYFKAMRIPLLEGRLFDKTDIYTPNQSRWVAIIDETLAKTYFPNEDPIGKQINQGPDATIIGVVGTVSQGELGEKPKATIYYPHTQHAWYGNMYVVTRSTLPLASVVPLVRNVVKTIDPNVPVFEPRMLDERVGASLAPRRLAMSVLTGLAALSLGLAIFGLYGVISYVVSQRTTEFGIRAALGAEPRQVRALVVRQGLRMASAGVAVGLAGAWVATRSLSALLFGVTAHDPLTFVGAAVLVTVVAIAATFVPARRATAIPPTEALRAG
jgi:putative ABC transport system permease protein